MRAPDQLRADILSAYYRARKEAERISAPRVAAPFVHLINAILEKQRRQGAVVSE